MMPCTLNIQTAFVGIALHDDEQLPCQCLYLTSILSAQEGCKVLWLHSSCADQVHTSAAAGTLTAK